jgi:hypothetical protein
VSEFTEKATKLQHPFTEVVSVHAPPNLKAMFNILTQGITGTRRKRVTLIADIAKMVVVLSSEEAALRARMEPGVLEIMKNKRLLAFKALLNEAGYRDVALID